MLFPFPETPAMTATQKKTRIVRSTASTSSTLRLDSGEVAHVGVDVPKASYRVAVVTDQRGLVATWTQPASPELLVGRLNPIRAGRPGRLRSRAHRLRPGPAAPGRRLPRRGDRPVEDPHHAGPGGQE